MEYVAHILIMAGLFVMLAVSLNLVLGYAGLPAMGQSAFFCVGAYASSLIAVRLGVSPWVTLMTAAILAGAAGWFVSLMASRLDGDFLALATFAFAIVAHAVSLNWIELTRGPLGIAGIPPFRFLGHSLDTAWTFLPLALLCGAASVWTVHRLVSAPFGRIIQGMRESAVVVTSLGVDTGRYSRTVFTIGAFFAGAAGALYAHYISYIDPSSFTPLESVTILFMVVFGGMGSISGSVLGAITLVVLPEILRFVGLPDSVAAPLRQMIYGGTLVGMMLLRPSGLLGRYRWQ